MTYLISQWGGATANYRTAAQRVLNKVARWVTKDSKKTKISELMN